jgi:hypothetical protein
MVGLECSLKNGRPNEGNNERSTNVGDLGRGVVSCPGMAVAQTGHLDLNAPGLLGREQKEGW